MMQPAIRLASEGFVLTEEEANGLHSQRLQASPGSRRIFQRDGDFYKAGERFKQPELARTLEHIAANPDDFYHGVMAQQIATFEKENGGLITAADLAAYQVKDREPLIGHYRGLEVITSPPPSSGGIALIETLNMLQGYDLREGGAGPVARADSPDYRGVSAGVYGSGAVPGRPGFHGDADRADGVAGLCGCVAEDD